MNFLTDTSVWPRKAESLEGVQTRQNTIATLLDSIAIYPPLMDHSLLTQPIGKSVLRSQNWLFATPFKNFPTIFSSEFLLPVRYFQKTVGNQVLINHLRNEQNFNFAVLKGLYSFKPILRQIVKMFIYRLSFLSQKATPRHFRRSKQPSIWVDQVVPKLREFVSWKLTKVELCHLISDTIWKFQQFLREQIYDLVDEIKSHFVYLHRSEWDINNRFPLVSHQVTASNRMIEQSLQMEQFMRELKEWHRNQSRKLWNWERKLNGEE
jgi:hypothetical protein